MRVIPVERSEEPESNIKALNWIPCQARNDIELILKATTFGGGHLQSM